MPAVLLRAFPDWRALWWLPLLLSACQTRPVADDQSWPERRAALQALQQYSFSGRLAVASGNEGFSAGLQWRQQQQRSSLSLQAPLGFSAALIDYDGTALRITGSDGKMIEGRQADDRLQDALGFAPPLSSLRYWLLGSSDPADSSAADETLDDRQRLLRLNQHGWLIEYDEYQRVGNWWLPRRLTLHRDQVRVRLAINRWQLG